MRQNLRGFCEKTNPSSVNQSAKILGGFSARSFVFYDIISSLPES